MILLITFLLSMKQKGIRVLASFCVLFQKAGFFFPKMNRNDKSSLHVLIHVPIKRSSGKHSFQKWSCNTVREHGKTKIFFFFSTATVQQNISSPIQAAAAQATRELAAKDHLSHPHSCTRPHHIVIIASRCFQPPLTAQKLSFSLECQQAEIQPQQDLCLPAALSASKGAGGVCYPSITIH